MERKLATLLFADLVGSTALGDELDPEHARDLLERFYDAMEAEIALGGGTVEKFIGDAVVAVFGAPAAQEDHAERALQTALWMHERLRELFDDRLALRIGVNSGEVVVGRPREGSSFATGDAVNVAARLEQAATPGQVLVGERTAALVGDAFEFGEPRTVEAKGKQGGVAARELRRMVAPRRPRGGQGLASTFVGRAKELDRLQQMSSTDEPRFALVVGEPGLGKTALVRELRGQLPAGTAFLLGRCLSYGRSVTYSPLADILRQELGLREDDPALEALAGKEILGLTLGLDVAGDLEPRAAVLALRDAWVRLVSEIAARGPAVLVLEDLHWATEPLTELVARVLSDATGPVLVLGTTRPGREGLPAGETVILEPLGDDEAAELIDRALAAPLDPAARELVVRHADGNPFFVEEVLSDLLDRELLTRRNGGWTLAAGSLTVPDSVQGVLAARIDLLDPSTKDALRAAAVIGRSFSPAGLAALVGSAAEVRTLVERGFVRATEPELVFKHALTREVAYGGLPKAERARRHAAYAEWLEDEDASDGRAGMLAYHYAEAINPEIAELAWRDREEDTTRLRAAALRWLRRAADLALARFDLDDRLGLLERAAELTPDDPEIWHSIGRVNALRFDGAAMRPAMERAIDLTDDTEGLADIYAELAFESTLRYGMWNPPLDDSVIQRWLARALELAAPQTRALGRALTTRAMWDDEVEIADQAVDLAERLDDPVLLSYACFARSGAAFVTWDYPTAQKWAQRRFALRARLTDPDQLAHILYYGATAALAVGRREEAEALVREHDVFASRLSTHHEVHALAVLLFVEEALAHWEAIRELQPRVERAVAENAGTPCVLGPRTLLSCAVANAALGLDEEARRLEEAAAAHGYEAQVVWLHPPQAHLALLRGDLGRASALLDESGTTWHMSMDCSLYGTATRLTALVAIGRNADAEEAARPLLEPGTYLEPFALRALGIARGDATLVAQAQERFHALGLDWYAAQTPALAG
ncbi:MAG TPA: adenylate/guanylate cyclase domain-containing protein [Gaiellaceae bacterium]|nr:adenylate/guanylate cyclase domain-containing protein [Gaiellaceae bacterium]